MGCSSNVSSVFIILQYYPDFSLVCTTQWPVLDVGGGLPHSLVHKSFVLLLLMRPMPVHLTVSLYWTFALCDIPSISSLPRTPLPLTQSWNFPFPTLSHNLTMSASWIEWPEGRKLSKRVPSVLLEHSSSGQREFFPFFLILAFLAATYSALL